MKLCRYNTCSAYITVCNKRSEILALIQTSRKPKALKVCCDLETAELYNLFRIVLYCNLPCIPPQYSISSPYNVPDIPVTQKYLQETLLKYGKPVPQKPDETAN